MNATKMCQALQSSSCDLPSDCACPLVLFCALPATRADGHDALVGFFDRFPQYKARKFYLTGESYVSARATCALQACVSGARVRRFL